MSWPFSSWHRLAVTDLHLAPSEFWAMPIADWLSLIVTEATPLDRAALSRLMKDYPDE